MIIRALDVNGDWTFGKGDNDYLSGIDAIAEDIQTRLQSFFGDCFFALSDGIDWFNLLGSKNEIGLVAAISTTLINTQNITGIDQLSINVDDQRLITIKYVVQTTLSVLSNSFQYDLSA